MAPKDGGFEWQSEAVNTLYNLLQVENIHAVIRSEPECPLAFVELFASDGKVSNGKYLQNISLNILPVSDFGEHSELIYQRYPDVRASFSSLHIFV